MIEPLNETILIIVVLVAREILQSSKLKKIIKENSEHIKENRQILTKLKNKIR